jgi:hypothetical protein
MFQAVCILEEGGWVYPLRLEVAPFLEEVSSQAMAKKKKASGKRFTIRAPGRKRFKTGPKPKGKGKDKDKDKNLEARSQRTDQDRQAHWADTGEFPAEIETVYSPCICRWDRELAMIAFDGWKSLHYGFKPQSRNLL